MVNFIWNQNGNMIFAINYPVKKKSQDLPTFLRAYTHARIQV